MERRERRSDVILEHLWQLSKHVDEANRELREATQEITLDMILMRVEQLTEQVQEITDLAGAVLREIRQVAPPAYAEALSRAQQVAAEKAMARMPEEQRKQAEALLKQLQEEALAELRQQAGAPPASTTGAEGAGPDKPA